MKSEKLTKTQLFTSILLGIILIVFLRGHLSFAFGSKVTNSKTPETIEYTCKKDDGTYFTSRTSCLKKKKKNTTMPKALPSPTLTPKKLIDCTGPDSVVFKTTQKECDDFNEAWSKPKPTPEPVKEVEKTQSTSQYTHTYRYNPPTYYPCTLNYPATGTSVTYNYLYKTQEECLAEQARIDAIYTPQPIDTSPSREELHSQCLDEAVTVYNREVQSAKVKYGSGSSMRDVAIRIAQSNYSTAVARCNSQFGQ